MCILIFYEKSSEYIYSEIRRLNQKEKSGLLDEYDLGKLAHYLSDFCCYAHINGDIGGLADHIGYEMGINRYLNENYDRLQEEILQNKTGMEKQTDMIRYVEENIKDYRPEEPCYSIDIEKSIEISTALLLNVLCDVKSVSFQNGIRSNKYAAVMLGV